MAKGLAAVVHQQQPKKSIPESGPIGKYSYNGNLILGRHFWNLQNLTVSCKLALKMGPKLGGKSREKPTLLPAQLPRQLAGKI